MGRKLLYATLIAFLLLPAQSVFAADDLQTVLRKLDVSAAKFRSTTASFEFDSIQTEPVPDKEVQTGTVYYQRNGSDFKMAAHITEENGKPVPKTYVYSDGAVKLYEKLIDQVTTLSKAAQYESWFMLGFGASGKDLEQKWDIAYLGPETIDGIKTEKLKLVPKDPAVRKNIPQVTVWMDTDRAVSVKQVIDQGSGNSRECLYSNIKVNQSLPGDAFTFKTDRQTTYVSH
jgi:outer membrane lipoprotein-sorting protein